MNNYRLYDQLISSPINGDCFRACMATLLQLPPEVLPNVHKNQHAEWIHYLEKYGLTIHCGLPKDPIWRDDPWIATVPSLNYEKIRHSIVMCDYLVFHDPSPEKKYKVGTSLLGSDIISSGTHIAILDITKIYKLDELRKCLVL